MRIEHVMEVSDTFVRAYESYKKLLKDNKENKTPDYILTKVALMFGLDNLKSFKRFVMKKEKEDADRDAAMRRSY